MRKPSVSLVFRSHFHFAASIVRAAVLNAAHRIAAVLVTWRSTYTLVRLHAALGQRSSISVLLLRDGMPLLRRDVDCF